ncbi:MAG: APC family permease [Mycoplasmataceae bacterium]|nr:APC family permease [Mycoplasmataceae bacterium]
MNINTKEETKVSKSSGKFGFFSIFVTIVGTVIGAGIFFKADSIYATTGSTIVSMISWIVAGVFILIMAVACLEIVSSSKNTDEAGTLSNWASKFVSPKFGTYVGLFLIFVYMPLTIIPLTQFTTDFISSAATGNATFNDMWVNVLITFAIFSLLTIINLHSSKTSRFIQLGGTIIKLIPLSLILISSLVFIIVDPGMSNFYNDTANIHSMSGGTMFQTLMLALPAVLFAYDGFIYAGSLQNETKKKGTFKSALVFGILFIVFIYTMLAFGLYGSGDINADNPFSVSSVVVSVFGDEVGSWMNVIISITIVISISTGLNGFITSGNRSFSSMSETNLIRDDNKKQQERNKGGVPYHSARNLAFINFVWFIIIYTATTFISISSGSFDEFIINVLSEFAVIIEFMLIGIIMLGGILNRKTKKVKVDKHKFFIPSAIITVIFTFFIGTYETVYYLFINPDAYNLTIGIIMISSIIILIFATNFQTRNMEKRYNNNWEKACNYVNDILLIDGGVIDLDALTKSESALAEIEKYNSKLYKFSITSISSSKYVEKVNDAFIKVGDFNYKLIRKTVDLAYSAKSKILRKD